MKIDTAAQALATLAQEMRLSIFPRLDAKGETMPAGGIAAPLKTPPATLWFHLKALLAAGLMEYLSQNCCKGRPVLCGVRAKQLACIA